MAEFKLSQNREALRRAGRVGFSQEEYAQRNDWRDVRVAGVYAIQGAGLIKIGIAWDVLERCTTIRKCSPVPITPLGMIPILDRIACFAREQDIHTSFAVHRQHGEWFEAVPALLAYITEHFQGWPTR